MKLDVPLAELALHEPDYKHLIAFLKAMEFNLLTRRVAEFSGIDAAQIEPDGRVMGDAARSAPAEQAPSPHDPPSANGRATAAAPERAPGKREESQVAAYAARAGSCEDGRRSQCRDRSLEL